MKNDHQKIGQFITQLRESRAMTQAQLASAVQTSQSAIARIEKGDQNVSTALLARVGKALNRNILSLNNDTVDLRIRGGKKLKGSITTNTAKNAALSIMAASLLNRGTTTLERVPRIEEVFRILEVLESIGVQTKWSGSTLEITPPKAFSLETMNIEAARRTRSVIMLIGPLIHSLKKFSLPHAGGCKLGKRTIGPHLFALENLGVKIKTTDNDYLVSATKLAPHDHIVMYESGDTATENIIMAAAGIDGITTIKHASPNYMVQDMCRFLQTLGIQIDGIGTTTITVHGKKDINKNVTYSIMEDPIESMMFLSIAATTNSAITIKRCPIEFLELELLLLEKMGFQYEIAKKYKGANGQLDLVDIKTKPSTLTALADNIHPKPFPGVNIDNLPFFVPIATQASGTTLIHDWVYENRAIYYLELNKLNAQITLADPHRVFVNGPTPLKAAQVISPPALRPAAIILIGMLAAEGTSILRNVYSISRGYEDLATRLQTLGADIEVLQEM